MTSDSDIKKDVEQELRWDADIDATDVGVTVKDGVVALSGVVRSYSQKWQAERDAKRVAGVAGVADDIEVRLPSNAERTDPEIARDAVSALKMQLPYLADSIQVMAANRHVTLEGTVEWHYQRQRAEEAVRRVKGIKGVINRVFLKPKTSAVDVKRKIEQAFRRSAQIDASHVKVKIDGGDVVLEGAVRTWVEREEAERAAWLAPGITSVLNHIMVKP